MRGVAYVSCVSVCMFGVCCLCVVMCVFLCVVMCGVCVFLCDVYVSVRFVYVM